MKDKLPKISILVITYNQGKIINRALDSILRQKEYVYEIIIGDDCSTDNNWEVINHYAKQYSDLVKPIRNKQNLGIFGNMENLYDKPTGDIVFWLSGDDEFCDGLFFEAIKLINNYNIDYKNELFCLYFDYKIVWSDNTSRIYRNNIIKKGFDPVSLKLRACISNRTTGYSVHILNKFSPVRKDIGIYADGLQDIQLQLNSIYNYYSSFVGSIYHAGIGVSYVTPPIEHFQSRLALYNELEQIIEWRPKDRMYLRYKKEKVLLYIKPSIKQMIIMMSYYFRAIDCKYGVKGLKIKETCFKIFKNTLTKLKTCKSHQNSDSL